MKRRGFTLVEMLVVITIVAILAVLAVSSYGVARKQAELDIAVDTVVSLMREQQGLAKSGRVTSESADADSSSQGQVLLTTGSERSCYGMRFTTVAGEDEGAIEVFEMPYYSYKDGEVDYCDLPNAESETPETQRAVEVRKISQFGLDKEVNDLYVVFKPPSGQLVMTNNSTVTLEKALYQNDASIVVTVGLPNSDDEKLFRIDTITGLTERVYETE